jgi:AraC-like DNA-binding protein
MEDFSSSAMIRVMHAGMARLGMAVPSGSAPMLAHTPLVDKRALIGQVLQQGGWSAVLQLGQGVHDVHDEPLLQLLVHPGEPWRVLAAWQRLERYLHSRHRIMSSRVHEHEVQLAHTGRKPSVTPLVAESWLVLGVVVALLQRSACRAVDVQLSDGRSLFQSDRLVASESELGRWVQDAQAQCWRLQWTLQPAETMHVQAARSQETSWSDQIADWIRKRQDWQPELHAVASGLKLSTRSLQRKLSDEGARFVDVVGRERALRATELLTQSHTQLAEIGFACGYTDQAHFSRDFKRRMGMTPLTCRQLSH